MMESMQPTCNLARSAFANLPLPLARREVLFMIMVMLFLTVLPYQTSQLVEAMSHTSR
jgi:hypothetical protein